MGRWIAAYGAVLIVILLIAAPPLRAIDLGEGPVLLLADRAVAVLPESVRYNLRQDLTSVPVTDAEPTTLVLAWPEANRSRSLAAFVRTATTVAERAAYELR